jgi:hypothetical protein
MTNSHDTDDEGLVQAFSQAAVLMDVLLEFHTGLSPFGRKLLTYYTLGSHALPHAQHFPLAKLRGFFGTGKSSALKVAKLFAYRPFSFSGRGCSFPVFRDNLELAYQGTALIEEGDAGWKCDPEPLLSDRYDRTSAQAGHKVPSGEAGFSTRVILYFGATIIHRRVAFADAALESRCVAVNFRPVHGRTYGEMGADWEAQWSEAPEVKAIQDLILDLPPVEQDELIAGRIWNTYTPVIAVAGIVGDSQFEAELIQKMEGITMTLKEAQATAELDTIAVRALIECMSKGGTLKIGEGISLKDIRDTVWKNTSLTASPFQLGTIFGDLGVERRKSHGITKLYASAAILVKVCTELGIDDEAVEELAKKLKSKNG